MAGFGAYGKMPALGDFFRIAPPPGFVEAWDPWLQERLLDLRNALGERWRDAYLTAPIWRFTLSPGTAGEGAVVGVLMPSVDRVGRNFPLTLAASAPGKALALHAAAEDTFVALEEIALAGIAVPDLPAARVIGQGPGHIAVETAGAAGPALLGLQTGGWSRPSVWSAVLNGTTRLMLSEGLPGPERAAALFDCGAALWSGGAAVALEAGA